MTKKIRRELKADLKHLRQKAVKLVDQLVITQDSIQKKKWQLKKGTHDRRGMD